MKKAEILLVDDEAVFVNNMSRLLKTRGYGVMAVSDGSQALDALRERSFDVMVLDMKMPVMNGIETLRQMKKLSVSTEVLLLTAHGTMDTAFEAIEMGAFDYVTKPCEIADLVAKIEAAHARKRAREGQD
jgi:DNA-binding NtrC family response regulator